MTHKANKTKLSQILRPAAAWCALVALNLCSIPLASAQTSDEQNFGGVPVTLVTTLADSGPGSFRAAINQTNNNPGQDEIRFAETGTINLESPLPAITDPVVINVTQAGGTAPTPNTPTIELNGQATQGTGPASIGLWIRAGNCTIKGFAINRFGEAGIRMDTDGMPQGGDDNGNFIKSSYIGTNVAGTAALPNINRGILIVGTTGHLIGGGSDDRNVISGNSGRGIDINAGGSAIVSGNYIGTNAAGTGDLGNTSDGVQIANSSNSIIGSGSGLGTPGNVISGNNGSGVTIITDFGFAAGNNLVAGNLIGTNAAGTAALGNNGSGVVIQAGSNDQLQIVGNTVGGATVPLRNVISGNRVNGISLGTTLATGNTIAGNYIGTGANGTTSIANRENGVQISATASGNTIGGGDVTPGGCDNSCNVIANNGAADSLSARAGVYVDPTARARNTIRGNSIFNHAGIGIDLGTVGSTPNDAGDPDTGANNLQNFPVILSALTDGNVTGSLDSTPDTAFIIEFFGNTAADGSGSEGRTYIGAVSTMTNGSGTATFSFSRPGGLPPGQFITATATSTGGTGAQAIGDTSEFSGQAAVTAAGAGASISGRVVYGVPNTDPAKPVANVTLTAVGPTTQSGNTDNSGNYTINNLVPGSTYTVTPSKTNELNGAITPIDATLILRFLAASGQAPNDLTARQQQAADVNNSGSVTALDATIILRFSATMGANNSGSQIGSWEFDPPQRTYPTVAGNDTDENYDAILLGDVNGSWAPTAPTGADQLRNKQASLESGANQVALADYISGEGIRGKTVLIPVVLNNAIGKQIFGYAVDVLFDPNALQIDAANPFEIGNGLTTKDFVVVSDAETPGRISIAAAAGSDQRIDGNGELFLLRFKVNRNGSGLTTAKQSTGIGFGRQLFEDENGSPLAVSAIIGKSGKRLNSQ